MDLKKILSIATPVLLTLLLSATLILTVVIATKSDSPSVPAGVTDTSPFPDDTQGAPEDSGNAEDTTPSDTPPIASNPYETTPPSFSSNGLEYVSNGNGTCYLAGIGSCSDMYIIVPDRSPAGDLVIGVGNNAFKNCLTLKGIELPNGISSIGSYAFYGSGLRSILIGGAVTSIGEYAFCGCYSLQSISVDTANTVYSDINGVLYNKACDVLITYPLGKSDNSIQISKSVVEIKTMAFYGSTSIKRVVFGGVANQWRLIEIGAGNEILTSAIMSFADSGGK